MCKARLIHTAFPNLKPKRFFGIIGGFAILAGYPVVSFVNTHGVDGNATIPVIKP